MRDSLIAFIKSVQDFMATGDVLRHQLELGGGDRGTLWFGYGYFDPGKVLWWPPPAPDAADAPEPVTMSIEEGVDTYLAAHGLCT